MPVCAALERVAFDHGTERPFSGRTADGAPWHNKATGRSSLFPGDTLRTRCTCVLLHQNHTRHSPARRFCLGLHPIGAAARPRPGQAVVQNIVQNLTPLCTPVHGAIDRRVLRRRSQWAAAILVRRKVRQRCVRSFGRLDSIGLDWVGLAAVEQLALLRALGSAWLGPKPIGCTRTRSG